MSADPRRGPGSSASPDSPIDSDSPIGSDSPIDNGRPLVIAVGNRFRGDDGVGATVLEAMGSDPSVVSTTDLLELDGEPTRLLDAWADRPDVVVLDAVADPGVPAGTVITLVGPDAVDPDTVARWGAGISGHSAGLAEALRLGLVLERMPGSLCVVGVVASSVAEGPGLTPPVAAAVPEAVAAVCRALESTSSWRGGVADVSG